MINERELAVYTLIDIIDEKAYNNISLRKTLNQNNALSAHQKAFVTELVNGTLKNLIYIDYVISQFSKTPIQKMKPLIINTLRISVHQLFFMDRVPVSAICNEAVKLVKARGFKDLSGFVNGVLRNIARAESIKLPDASKDFIKYLSVKYSYPSWLVAYFCEELGKENVEKMFIDNAKSPKITIAVNTLKTSVENVKANLLQSGMEVNDSTQISCALQISKTSDLSQCKDFTEGSFHIINESSMLAVQVLDPKKHDTIIDLCAAPGGKTFYSAYLTDDSAKIIASDIFGHKIDLIKSGCERLGILNVETRLNDATVTNESLIGIADALIIDAPCSGLGLIRKKPDIKYSKTQEDINALSKIQREILAASFQYVKESGVLVYSTCTISKKENFDNIEWFVNNYPFELVDISDYLPEDLKTDTAKCGFVQILPDTNRDGFFIAKLRRKTNA